MKIVNGYEPLTIFVKSSILDVCQNSEYTSGIIQMMVAKPINRIVISRLFYGRKDFFLSNQILTFFNILPIMILIVVETCAHALTFSSI